MFTTQNPNCKENKKNANPPGIIALYDPPYFRADIRNTTATYAQYSL